MERLKFPVTKKDAEKMGIPYSSEANKNALFPSRLRNLRKEKGVSQKELADFLGLSKSTVGLYETGDTLPRRPSTWQDGRVFLRKFRLFTMSHGR